MDLGLKDRVYVVTGATRGLGNASARELVADGAKVVITGRDEKTVAEAAAALGPNARRRRRRQRRPGGRRRGSIAAARERFGGFDGILISVGGPAPGFVADNTDEQWQSAFESVFLGAVRLARAAAAELGEGGVIGFVLSGSVHEPIPGLTISNGLRPGLAGLRQVALGRAGPARHPGRRAAAGPDRHGPRARARRAVGRPGGHPRGATSPASRCAATARRRSSAGRPRSCCPRRRRT